MTKKFEALASGDALELRIYGPIGAGLFGEGISADLVSNALANAGNVSTITVRMSCPGGSAYDGMAIRAMLAAHPAKKTCEIEGLAASAGSIVAMGCDTIRMHTGGALMIHEATARGMGGRAEDLRKAMDALETLNDGMASIYAERTGMTKVKCRSLMAAETWLTPEQAQKQGFCDEVVPGKQKMAAAFDLSAFGYQHVPPFVAQRSGDQTVPILPPEPEPDQGTDDDVGEDVDDEDADDDDDEAEQSEGTTQPVPTLTKEDLREAMESLLSTRANTSVPQSVAAATTAEASAARKRLQDMSIKLIAQAAGLQADADDSAVISAVSQQARFVAELKSVTKSDSFEAVLGSIRGLQAAAEQLPTLTAKVEEQAKQLEDQERAALFAADKADPAGRKFTPALEKLYETKSPAEIRAFMAAAPVALRVEAAKSGTSQPESKTADSSATSLVTYEGRAWEALTPAEKHNLYVDDPKLYESMKRNHVERGEPRAQGQQQRASA